MEENMTFNTFIKWFMENIDQIKYMSTNSIKLLKRTSQNSLVKWMSPLRFAHFAHSRWDLCRAKIEWNITRLDSHHIRIAKRSIKIYDEETMKWIRFGQQIK